MTISQFAKEVDDVLLNIKKVYQKSLAADFEPQNQVLDVSLLHIDVNAIPLVVTKDEVGNALTDDDGKKVYSATDLLELDRQEHLQEVARQKILLLEKLTSPITTKQEIDEIHKAYANLQAKEEFFKGQGDELNKRLVSTENVTENVALVYGPLNRNIYTEQYQELVKGMVANQDFTLDKNNQTNEYFVKMNGKEYNLTEILKFANLTHLTLDKQDCENYVSMLATKPMAYKPDVDQSDAASLAPQRGKVNADKSLTSEEKKRTINGMIDKILLNNIDKANQSKPDNEKDNSLAQISTGERLAINIWTTGFFDCANPFLRGDLEGTFEKTRAMSDLVGNCSLRLMSDLPKSGPESGKLYLGKNDQGDLIYTVRTPQNMVEQDQVLTIKGLNLPKGDLTLDELNKHKDKILEETTKRGHVAIKEKGREDALRELMCTTAFVMQGASYVSPTASSAQQTMYRGDDGLYDPVLQARLKAAQSQDVISLNNIASTAKDNPNVDFAFNAKDENKDKVKVGSIHNAIGKDISAISAFQREKEFLSVSRHKQYEGALKTGENEYLFKVQDVRALNQLAPEELITRNDLKPLMDKDKQLKKQEKSVLSKVSSSKRKKVQTKQDDNDLKKAQLIENKKLYLAEIAALRKPDPNEDPTTKPAVAPHSVADNAAAIPAQNTQSRKRNRADTVEDSMRSAARYTAKKMRQMRDMIAPSAAPHVPVQAPLSASQAPLQTSVTEVPKAAQTITAQQTSTNPLMLPTAQMRHLRDLENEITNLNTLPNSSGGIEHLMIRQFQVDTTKPAPLKTATRVDAQPEEDKKRGRHP